MSSTLILMILQLGLLQQSFPEALTQTNLGKPKIGRVRVSFAITRPWSNKKNPN
jgi:hypothetical protein